MAISFSNSLLLQIAPMPATWQSAFKHHNPAGFCVMEAVLARFSEFGVKFFEQICLVVFSTLLALLIGIPLGIVLSRKTKLKNLVMGFANVMQTIPSLALLALLLPIFGIGITPALIALVLYALLPILRNTLVGLANVPHASIEAARGLGFSYFQRLWFVELPLAAPVILAGIRTATVVSVGIATLAAFIGAGGLGDFINRGLALNDVHLVLWGAIPAAVLALSLDFLLAKIESYIAQPAHRRRFSLRKFFLPIMIAILILGSAGYVVVPLFTKQLSIPIRVASKNFTEQLLLGEIIAQLLEAKTSLKIERKFNLGTTAICHEAMLNNEIDIYPEYSGTAYMAVLHQKKIQSPQRIFSEVKNTYKQKFNIIWLAPFGFENTQRLAVRKQFAEKYKLSKTSDLVRLAPQLTLGAPPEFTTRPDAGPALQKLYGIHFAAIKALETGLMYKAIRDGYVDVIFAFSTDGRISAYELTVLKDDKQALPPYQAAPIIRAAVLQTHPEIDQVLATLKGKINDQTMQQMNYQIVINNQSVVKIAREFLIKNKLI